MTHSAEDVQPIEVPPTPDWVIRRARKAVRSALRTTTIDYYFDVARLARIVVAELDGQWLLRQSDGEAS